MKWKEFLKSTILKYIFSYAAILIIVITGMYFIINHQLKQVYIKEYLQESRAQISNAADRISEGFLEIEKTNLILSSDMNIINARYNSNTDYSRYQIVKELAKYRSRNIFSRDIIYFDRKRGVAYSTTRQCRVAEGSINFTMYGENDILIPESYYDSDTTFGKVYSATNGTATLLLFSPKNSSSDFRVIYVLDQEELTSVLNACLSKGITGVELTDLSGGTILSCGAAPVSGVKEESAEASEDIFTLRLTYPELVFHAAMDKNFIQSLVDTVFLNTYLTVGLLAVVAIIMTFCSMKITYFPLYELKKRITKSRSHLSNYIALLGSTYQESEELNLLLRRSLNNYKTVIHESILNSKYISQNISNTVLDSIDKLFSAGNKLILAVAKITFLDSPEDDTIERIQSHFRDAFTFAILEADPEHVSLLLAWEEEKDPDDLVLKHLLEGLLSQIPCMIAFSNRSASLFDIARLYSNATTAESYLSFDCRIVGYDDISEKPDQYDRNYSYRLFDQLAAALEQMDTENSFRLLKELLDFIDTDNDSEIFIRCILIDTTTLIGTSMNRSAVKYEKYRAIINQTLDLCRKSNYAQTKKEILNNFYTMTDILYSESSGTISTAQIEAFVRKNFCRSDFSITMLADHFHVSIAYMSSLFKRDFDVNFSNYVWALRYKKARLLLSTTDYPIEKIGALVGYDNVSSFRRKFKEESGISPSSYRKNMREPLVDK